MNGQHDLAAAYALDALDATYAGRRSLPRAG